MRSTHRDRPGDRSDRPTPRPARESPPTDLARLAATGGTAHLAPGAAAPLQRAVEEAAFAAAAQRDTHVHGAGCGHAPGKERSVQRSPVPGVLRSGGKTDPLTATDVETHVQRGLGITPRKSGDTVHPLRNP